MHPHIDAVSIAHTVKSKMLQLTFFKAAAS